MKQRITRIEVARMLELDEGFLIELEAHDIVVPDPEGFYDAVRVERARLCCTLHRGLGVNFEGLDVVLDLLERWEQDRRRTRELLLRLRAELDRSR